MCNPSLRPSGRRRDGHHGPDGYARAAIDQNHPRHVCRHVGVGDRPSGNERGGKAGRIGERSRLDARQVLRQVMRRLKSARGDDRCTKPERPGVRAHALLKGTIRPHTSRPRRFSRQSSRRPRPSALLTSLRGAKLSVNQSPLGCDCAPCCGVERKAEAILTSVRINSCLVAYLGRRIRPGTWGNRLPRSDPGAPSESQSIPGGGNA